MLNNLVAYCSRSLPAPLVYRVSYNDQIYMYQTYTGGLLITKTSIFSLFFFAQDIHCGYMLQPLHRGSSVLMSNHNLMFWISSKKNGTPVHGAVFLYKSELKGYTFHGHVFLMLWQHCNMFMNSASHHAYYLKKGNKSLVLSD